MMVDPEGRAVGIEHIPELVAASIKNVKRSAAAPFLEKGSLSLHVAGMQISEPFRIFFYHRDFVITLSCCP